MSVESLLDQTFSSGSHRPPLGMHTLGDVQTSPSDAALAAHFGFGGGRCDVSGGFGIRGVADIGTTTLEQFDQAGGSDESSLVDQNVGHGGPRVAVGNKQGRSRAKLEKNQERRRCVWGRLGRPPCYF